MKAESAMTKTYKLLTLFVVLNITFQLIADATASKIIMVAGFGVSVTVLYFPFTYIISDILTEVYGYGVARRVLWYTVLASVIAGVVYQIAVAIPPAPFFTGQEAYSAVFGAVPRVLLGGWIAVIAGDFTNNYVLARMKVRFEGRKLWLRTVTSTLAGQLVNTAAFYVIALGGVLPTAVLGESIVAGWVLKTAVEVVMTPVTYAVVSRLKAVEGVDHYDRDTNFNPFSLK